MIEGGTTINHTKVLKSLQSKINIVELQYINAKFYIENAKGLNSEPSIYYIPPCKLLFNTNSFDRPVEIVHMLVPPGGSPFKSEEVASY